VPHEPTDVCAGDHCFSCHEDEPIMEGEKAYRVCGECFHVYWTARDLRRAYRRADRQMSGPWTLRGMPGWDDNIVKRVWRNVRIQFLLPASKIYFCQECLHDW
jgi:hypothetical protein